MHLHRNSLDEETACPALPAPSPASSEQLMQTRKEMLLSHQAARGWKGIALHFAEHTEKPSQEQCVPTGSRAAQGSI